MNILGSRFAAALVGLGSLALGALGMLSDLDEALARHENLSTYRRLVKNNPQFRDEILPVIGKTMIVPSNEAFEHIVDWNSYSNTEVVNILRYHVVPGTLSINTIEEGKPIFAKTQLDGASVIVSRQNGDEVVFTSGGARRSTLIGDEISFSNGVIQIIDTVMAPPPGLVEICLDYNPLSAFLGALYQTNISEQIITSKNITIFAPINEAFQRISGALSSISQSELLRVLKFHIVPTVLYSSDLINGTTWPTLAGQNIVITAAGNNRYIESSHLLDPDILVPFGVVHKLSNVLNPAEPDARPVPTMWEQEPEFALTGSISTGSSVPVPFTSALPCTTCVARHTHTGTHSSSVPSENGVGGARPPKCTGLAGAMGVGVLGVGMLEVAGVL